MGCWQQDANGPFVVVSASIRCDEAAKKSGEVTFTHDAWTTINREMDTRFVDLKIVGWYHSHPGFGVFLSERDVFIHEHFFSNPGQVALVVDPTQKIGRSVRLAQRQAETLLPLLGRRADLHVGGRRTGGRSRAPLARRRKTARRSDAGRRLDSGAFSAGRCPWPACF